MRRLTLADLESRGIGPVYVPVAVGHNSDGDGTDADGHHPPHDVPEVLCVLHGEGVVEIDGVTTPFGSGDVFIIEPGEQHRLIGHGDLPVVHAWLQLRSN